MPKAKRTTSPGRVGAGNPRLGEALEFMRALWEVDHALRRVSKSMKSKMGVTGPQRLVIRLVGRFPGLNAGELAELMHIDPSSLTGILDRLEKAKLLERRADRLDRRRALFSLTRAGKKLDGVRSGTVEAAVVRALQNQPTARTAAARQLLVAVADELEKRNIRSP